VLNILRIAIYGSGRDAVAAADWLVKMSDQDPTKNVNFSMPAITIIDDISAASEDTHD
jgi:hypothetical protein